MGTDHVGDVVWGVEVHAVPAAEMGWLVNGLFDGEEEGIRTLGSADSP